MKRSKKQGVPPGKRRQKVKRPTMPISAAKHQERFEQLLDDAVLGAKRKSQ